MPSPGPGVCAVCRGPSSVSGSVCFCCRVVARRLGLPLAPVRPARLCPLPSALYSVLLGYKESPVADVRERLGAVVRALVHEALVACAGDVVAMVEGEIELVVPVPSTSRLGPSVLARVPGLARVVADAVPAARWEPELVHRTRTRPAPLLAHMRPHAAGFAVSAVRRDVTVSRAVLLDDTYVSGARAQSAAAALRRSGVRRVVVVPLGRVLRPDRVPAHARFLERHRRCAAAGTGGQ